MTDQKKLKIAYDPIYAHPLPEGHRFPMLKYELIPGQLLWQAESHGSGLPAAGRIGILAVEAGGGSLCSCNGRRRLFSRYPGDRKGTLQYVQSGEGGVWAMNSINSSSSSAN